MGGGQGCCHAQDSTPPRQKITWQQYYSCQYSYSWETQLTTPCCIPSQLLLETILIIYRFIVYLLLPVDCVPCESKNLGPLTPRTVPETQEALGVFPEAALWTFGAGDHSLCRATPLPVGRLSAQSLWELNADSCTPLPS